jgi:ATP-dependent DNA helicase PIF1
MGFVSMQLQIVSHSLSQEALLGKLSDAAKQRWNTVKVLVVDEISMVDGRLFEKLEYIARHVRNSAVPWGGIQVLL